MQPQSQEDYKKLLTDVIKKQIVILGPDITLSKARNVKGLVVADDGTVTSFEGSPQQVTQALIDQFVQLSGLIVKKTMEPLLVAFPDGANSAAAPATTPLDTTQGQMSTPVQTVSTSQTPMPAAPAPAAVAPVQTQPAPQAPVTQATAPISTPQPQVSLDATQGQAPTSTPVQPQQAQSPVQTTPAPAQQATPSENPLAA